jgi:hypothetical protein
VASITGSAATTFPDDVATQPVSCIVTFMISEPAMFVSPP